MIIDISINKVWVVGENNYRYVVMVSTMERMHYGASVSLITACNEALNSVYKPSLV